MLGSEDVLSCLSDYVGYFALESPDRVAVVFGPYRVTYTDLQNEIEVWSRALIASGIGKGDRVAMLCTPRSEFWTLFLAAIRIGAIWVGLNPKYQRDELCYLVSDCEPKLLFSLVQWQGRDYRNELSALKEEFICIDEIVPIGGTMPGATPLEDFLQRAGTVKENRCSDALGAVTGADPALIVYTSGTTGKPKGAVISHYGLTGGATIQTTHLRVERPAIVVNFPINHVACVADTCATTLVKGGKIVFQERFDPAATLQAIEDEHCNIMGGVPTMLQMMLADPGFSSFDLSSVELVAWGGAAMPRAEIDKLEEICPRLMQLYGLTESSANVVYGEEGAPPEILAETIGKPDQNVECRIVDDAGNACGLEVAGELQFRAGILFKGYWNRPKETRDSFTPDGWLKTGDIGFLREDGNIELVGRRSEMYKSGGYNIYPREIEIVLESIPSVVMAAVIGVPNELYQEVGHAYVLVEPGSLVNADQLKSICRAKLANYKIPKRFSVRHELPMLPVGKINKQALKSAVGGPHQRVVNGDPE